MDARKEVGSFEKAVESHFDSVYPAEIFITLRFTEDQSWRVGFYLLPLLLLSSAIYLVLEHNRVKLLVF